MSLRAILGNQWGPSRVPLQWRVALHLSDWPIERVTFVKNHRNLFADSVR